MCNALRMPETELIGSKRACEILSIDRATLIRWIAEGKLGYAQKLPGSNGPYLFEESAVESLAAELGLGETAASA
jgi:predicted site-specific integrase-resolvase